MQVHIVGNLTGNPDTGQTPNGHRKARFAVAVDDGHRDRAGQWVSRPTLFFKIEAWDENADVAARLGKGAPVVVVGEWRANEYEQDGEQRRRQYVLATVVAGDEARATARAAARVAKAKANTPATAQDDDDFFGDGR